MYRSCSRTGGCNEFQVREIKGKTNEDVDPTKDFQVYRSCSRTGGCNEFQVRKMKAKINEDVEPIKALGDLRLLCNVAAVIFVVILLS